MPTSKAVKYQDLLFPRPYLISVNHQIHIWSYDHHSFYNHAPYVYHLFILKGREMVTFCAIYIDLLYYNK